jgi:hypothetical protein
MKKIILQMFAYVLAMAALVYAADYLVWRIRAAKGKGGYANITVQYHYEIGEKNGKTEYAFQPPQTKTCVNSVFPHEGYSPCWYERKHREKVIRI